MKAQLPFYFLLISQTTVSYHQPPPRCGFLSRLFWISRCVQWVGCGLQCPHTSGPHCQRPEIPLPTHWEFPGSSQGPRAETLLKTLSAYADLPFSVSHLLQSHTQPLGLCHLPALSTGGPFSGSVLATWTHPLRPCSPSEAPTRGTKPRTHHSGVPAFLSLAPNTLDQLLCLLVSP